jgi:hypothetical protein
MLCIQGTDIIALLKSKFHCSTAWLRCEFIVVVLSFLCIVVCWSFCFSLVRSMLKFSLLHH